MPEHYGKDKKKKMPKKLKILPKGEKVKPKKKEEVKPKKKAPPKKLIIKPKEEKKAPAKPKKKPKKMKLRIVDRRDDKAQPKKGNIKELRRRPRTPTYDRDFRKGFERGGAVSEERARRALGQMYLSPDGLQSNPIPSQDVPPHHPAFGRQQIMKHTAGSVRRFRRMAGDYFSDDPKLSTRMLDPETEEPAFLREADEDSEYGTGDPDRGLFRYEPSVSFMRRFGHKTFADPTDPKGFAPGRDMKSSYAEEDEEYDWA